MAEGQYKKLCNTMNFIQKDIYQKHLNLKENTTDNTGTNNTIFFRKHVENGKNLKIKRRL